MVSSVAGDASSDGAEETTRELIIHSNGDDGYVEVTNTCTLSKVRQLIIEEFDTEQLPSSSEEFAFKINNIRLSQKQEARRNAFDLVERQVKVEIIPRVTSNNDTKKRKIDNDHYLQDNSNSNDNKKSKIEATCAVTPFGISSIENKRVGNNDNGNGGSNATGTGAGDESTIGTVDASANSVARPTNLDKKKFSANDDARDDDEEDLNDLGLDSLKNDNNTFASILGKISRSDCRLPQGC